MEIGSHSVSHSRVFSKFGLGDGEERYPLYRPFVRDATHTENATILGELRVSRFLLERLVNVDAPVSFRPGHLQDPYMLPQALAVADKISRYGGLFLVLIHPDILDHKLEFQKGLVEALKGRAWFGSLREFGNWWTARDQIVWRIERAGTRRSLVLDLPQPISGLALHVPESYRLVKAEPQTVEVQAVNHALVVKQASGRITLEFETSGGRH